MPSQRVLKQALAAIVLLLVFIVYLPCLNAGFVNWDDDVHVLKLDTSHIWTSTVNRTYIPLTASTWALERHFFGLDPFIFHLDNILLHLLVSFLVIVFSLRMGLSYTAACLAGLLFGTHPIHVESVAWVTERKDVLYGAFFMAALLAYLRYLDGGKRQYFWWTLMLGGLSICAKPMALSLPFALLVLDWFRGRQGALRIIMEKLLCVALLAPFAYVTFLLNTGVVQPAAGKGPFIWTWCFIFYFYKFLLPWPSILFYGLPKSGLIFYLNTLAFTVLMAAMIVFRRSKLFIFAVVFYFANIFYLLRFHPFLSMVSDRFMYIPSIGICMFFAVLIEKTLSLTRNFSPAGYLLKISLGALIVAMSLTTWRQCEVWHSGVTLWRHQLRYDSGTSAWLSLCKLADAYAARDKHLAPDSKEFEEIRKLYLGSIALKVNYPESYNGMTRLYASVGDFNNAKRYYKLANFYAHHT